MSTPTRPPLYGELVRFPTEDGKTLEGMLFGPSESTLPIVIRVHGIFGTFHHHPEVTRLVPGLVEAGVPVLSFNNRGSGTLGTARDLFAKSPIDILAALDFVESRGFTRAVLCGFSLGGLKAAYYAASVNDPRVAGLALVSAIPGYRYDPAVVEEAERRNAAGEGIIPFSRIEGSWLHSYEPRAVLANAAEFPEGVSTLEFLERTDLPIFSSYASGEWEWFHETSLALAGLADTRPRTTVARFDGEPDHCFIDSGVLLEWLRKEFGS